MYLSFARFHWLRFIGAVAAIVLAVVYLLEFEAVSLAGFAFIAAFGTYLGIGLRRGNLPARCDLCGSPGSFSAEYDAGFANTRLILDCRNCGRVVNTSERGIVPEKG